AVTEPKGKLSFRERWFGLEQQKTEASANEIRSTIPGEFTGWNGKTWFKLANGQEWVQIDSSRLVTRASNPGVTIKRTFTGAYYLKIDSQNKRCKVRRAN
ncbi:MAG: hypothetical protein LJE84_08550, partial [Gammaproteobacteria bacterium]|nr:hypothetical protein [Gammaproteobacteria bacterium]